MQSFFVYLFPSKVYQFVDSVHFGWILRYRNSSSNNNREVRWSLQAQEQIVLVLFKSSVQWLYEITFFNSKLSTTKQQYVKRGRVIWYTVPKQCTFQLHYTDSQLPKFRRMRNLVDDWANNVVHKKLNK